MNKFSKMTIKLAAVALILAVTLLVGCTEIFSTTICHATGDQAKPYEIINVNSIELNEHTGHISDIIPAPKGVCPTSPVEITDGKITICHATGSKTNAYEEIAVSVNGLYGHDNHGDDIIPAPQDGCPASKP